MKSPIEPYEVFYSKDDKGYIARKIGVPGCSAFGDTEEEALRELDIAWSLHREVVNETQNKE